MWSRPKAEKQARFHRRGPGAVIMTCSWAGAGGWGDREALPWLLWGALPPACLTPAPGSPASCRASAPVAPVKLRWACLPVRSRLRKDFLSCSSHLQSGLFPASWEGPRASSRGADEGSGCWHLVALDPFPPVLPVVFISRCQRGDRDTVSGSDLPEVIERARGGAEARTAAWGLAFVPLTRSVSKPKQQER